MNREESISIIKNFLAQQSNIVFAYLFGSAVTSEVFRDIDIAIYTDTAHDLMALGYLQSELDKQIGSKLDIISLNNLPDKNPALAFGIVTDGKLLVMNNKQQHTAFKKKALLYYFDTAPLREAVNKTFKQRLHHKQFGNRNYA